LTTIYLNVSLLYCFNSYLGDYANVEVWVASVEVACEECYRCMQNCWFLQTLRTTRQLS